MVSHVRSQNLRELAAPVLILMAAADEDGVTDTRGGRTIHRGISGTRPAP